MLKDGKIWIAQNDQGENIFILPKMANRHGLVAGATGTGKPRHGRNDVMSK